MDNSSGNPIVTDFFEENAIEVLRLNMEKQQKQAYELIRKFVNRNGKYVTY